MWKKIHSNRDPRDTVYSEISKEFNPYFKVVDAACRSLFFKYPRFIFGAMVTMMALSALLAFTIFRHPDNIQRHHTITVNPVSDGFGQIMRVSGKIRRTLQLKRLIDSLSAKKQLSGADTAALDTALNELQRIRNIN